MPSMALQFLAQNSPAKPSQIPELKEIRTSLLCISSRSYCPISTTIAIKPTYDGTQPNLNGTIHLPDGKIIPEQGLGAILAVAAFINDVDVIGNGNNIGYQIMSKEDGQVYAKTVKIDPGEAFNVMQDIVPPARHIRIALQALPNTLAFDTLPEQTRNEFMLTLHAILDSNEQEIARFFNRRGGEYFLLRDGRSVQNMTEQLMVKQQLLRTHYATELRQTQGHYQQLCQEQRSDQQARAQAEAARFLQQRHAEDAHAAAEARMRLDLFRAEHRVRERGEALQVARAANEQIALQADGYREEMVRMRQEVESYLHTMMKHDYASRCAFLEIPMETERFPMADLYTNLSLIAETEQEKREAVERELRYHERDTVMESLHARQKETKTIELKEIFEPKESRKAKKVLLVGRAGVGKTTLCQKIAYDWACGNLWTGKFESIVWIPLRQLNERVASSASLAPEKFRNSEEWLIAAMKEVGLPSLQGSLIIDALRNYLTQHRSSMLILLDGYDEANPTVAEMVQRLITEDRGHAKPLHLLITTRPGDLAGIHACTDTHVESVGFSEEQSKAYITRFFSEHAKRSGRKDLTQDFLKVLEQNPMTKGLSGVPLQLQMMCSLYEKKPDAFGTNMTSLYTTMMTAFWEWSVSKGIGTLEQKERVLQALGAIAEAGLCSGQLVIPGTTISALMTPFRDVATKTVLGLRVDQSAGKYTSPRLYVSAFDLSGIFDSVLSRGTRNACCALLYSRKQIPPPISIGVAVYGRTIGYEVRNIARGKGVF